MKTMFDWTTWLMGIIQGTITAIIGGVIIFIWLIPRMTKATTKRTIDELKKDPEIKPILDKAKEIVDKLQPLAAQFKNINLEQIQRDFKPLYDAIKQIDAKDIASLVATLRELSGTVTKALEKPKKPLPEPE